MAINRSKGILIGVAGTETENNPSPSAYGGYAFSANYSINFTQPSKMTVSFVSEDGTYDEVALAARIFPGQDTNYGSNPSKNTYTHEVVAGETIKSIATNYKLSLANLIFANQEDSETTFQETYNRLKSLYEKQAINIPRENKVDAVSLVGGAISYDVVEFAGQVFKMHPLKYSITEGPDGRYLQIDYYDRSIRYLDKVVVVLNEKHKPPVFDPAYPPFVGGFSMRQEAIIGLGSGYVNAREKASGIPGESSKEKDAQKKLPTYLYSPYELAQGIFQCPWLGGMIDEGSLGLLSRYPLLYGGSNGNDQFLKAHVGTLREVLNAWAQDLGFIFYWEPTTDQLKLMNLRDDLSFNIIQKTVEKAVAARNITERNWSFSIEDTFSKGVAAYWGRDGMPEGDSKNEQLYLLDLLDLSIHTCKTKTAEEVECSSGVGSGTIHSKVNYCLNTNTWAAKTMKGVRSSDATADEPLKDLLNYIRLLKAAAIGSDFYKIYILNKKAWEESEAKFTDYGGAHPNISLYSNKKISSEELAEQFSGAEGFWGGNNTKLSGRGNTIGVSANALVTDLYGSTSATTFNEVIYCKDEDNNITDSWIVGDDCLSIELLYDRGQAQIDQLYRLSAARLVNAASNTSEALSESESEEGNPGRGYYFYRVKKYGITSLLGNATEDHVFKLLQGIGMNQGRFYYSKELQTSEDFTEKNYDADGVGWYDRELDVADTPLGELYYAIDPQAVLASNPMPNGCIEGKDGESSQVDKDGKPFEDPENTARPTIEQFIQQVYGDTIVDKTDGRAASLNVSVSGGSVSAVSVSDGGENYLGGGDGELAVNFIDKDGGAGAEAVATIEKGQVKSISVSSGGTDYTESVTAEVGGSHESSTDVDVFGKEATKDDSILASNLAELIEQTKKKCEETNNTRLGITLVDLGSSVKIPNLIQQRIKRHVDSFSIIPTSNNLSLITYLDDAGYQVISLAKPVPIGVIRTDDQYKEWFKEKDAQKAAPKDELDFIVDQVEIPKLDAIFGEATKNKVSLTSNFTFAGDKFETRAMIRPLHESNVREVNMEFLTPSEKDLGVIEGDCVEDGEEATKKRKQDDELIQANIAAYANAYAYQQQRVEYNAQVSVVDDQLRNSEGEIVSLTVEKGLESLSARIGDDGTKLTYGIGTVRKRRVVNKPFEDLWLRVKPEFYNNVFDV